MAASAMTKEDITAMSAEAIGCLQTHLLANALAQSLHWNGRSSWSGMVSLCTFMASQYTLTFALMALQVLHTRVHL